MTKKIVSTKSVLFTAVSAKQHESIRLLSYSERRSMAALVREALDDYIQKNEEKIMKAKRKLVKKYARFE
jgi:hypothetical protein